jgi:hypothetical protein
VTDLIRPEPKPLYALKLKDASGEIETFHATDDHPWKVEGKGWVETQHLKPEDRIDTASGEDMVLLTLEQTERVDTPTTSPSPTGTRSWLVKTGPWCIMRSPVKLAEVGGPDTTTSTHQIEAAPRTKHKRLQREVNLPWNIPTRR